MLIKPPFTFRNEGGRRDWLIFLGKAALLLLLLFVVTTFVAVEITERPSFCRSCHIMEPYYQSWSTSSHRDVFCIECHYEPSLGSEIEGKLAGLRQVVVYFTGGEGTRPWAEVSDASCLRSGCHETRLLDGLVDFNGIKFDHRPHLEEERRGRRLRCTTCHSQIVQGSHLTVTPSACFLCHFKDEPVGEPIGGCLGCHHVPSETITLPGGIEYLHSNYVESGVPCVSCHASVTSGDGFVPRQRCYVCHNFGNIDELLNDHTRLHEIHVTEHKVECTDCHEEITHGYDSERREARLDCLQCHEGMHAATARLAEGDLTDLIGETRPHVGPMLAARVECVSCHISVTGSDTEHLGSTRRPSIEACVRCHGERGEGIFRQWSSFFRRRIPEVERAIRRSRASDTDLRTARYLLDTVRLGRPVHNPSLGRDLLDAAQRLASGGELRVERPVAERRGGAAFDCSYCHLVGPRQVLRFEGNRFVHEPHTEGMGLPCDLCHEAAPTHFPHNSHGGVRITPEDCRGCHHRQSANCSACHGRGPSRAIRWRGLDFPHRPHTTGGVSCRRCHTSSHETGEVRGVRGLSNCASCHHTLADYRVCSTCHEATGNIPETTVFRGIEVPHSDHIEMGVGCENCHSTSDEGVRLAPRCGSCHHDPSMRPDCSSCHEETLPDYTEFRSARLPHRLHDRMGLACLDCHAARGGSVTLTPPCAMCHHNEGMSPECSACHGDGPEGRVPYMTVEFPHEPHISFGLACTECHGRTGEGFEILPVCSVCHGEGFPPPVGRVGNDTGSEE